MGIDPNIEELKGKDVIAMETVDKSTVDFYYLENGKAVPKRIYGKRSIIFKNYALACGMVWDGIRVGKGYEPCHDFKNGRLFVPLRGAKGVVHVREDQYQASQIRDGQTYILCKCGLEIPACKSGQGNQEKMKEAREIAINLGYYPERRMPEIAEASTGEAKITSPLTPLVEPADSYGMKEETRPKKKRPEKKGFLLRDILDAYPLEKEIRSGEWHHVGSAGRNRFNNRAARSQKESELKEDLSLFYDMIGEWDGESS